MSDAKVQYQRGVSWFEFLEGYGTEGSCEARVRAWRWPEGFVCPRCAGTRHSEFLRAARTHEPHLTRGGATSHKHPSFVAINTVLGSLKTSISGSHHAFALRTHAQRYPGQVEFLFHLRFDLRLIPPAWARLPAALHLARSAPFARLNLLADQVSRWLSPIRSHAELPGSVSSSRPPSW